MKLRDLLNELLPYDKYIIGISNYLDDAPSGQLDIEFDSIVNSSSNVQEKSLFVAVEGTSIDGHEFIGKARQSGAVFCVGSKQSKFKPDLVVANTRAFISAAASVFYNKPSNNLNIYGITGTNGKTTTSYILSSILKAKDDKSSIIGTTGIFVNDVKRENIGTTPDSTVLQKLFSELLNDNINNVVMEVSSHALAQYRVLGTYFKSVAFTNLTQDHLDFHENFESYFEAKSQLFNGLYAKDGVINIDNDWGKKLFNIARQNSMSILTTSTQDVSADVYIQLISSTLAASVLEVTYKRDNSKEVVQIKSSLVGDFNVENIATAIAMALQANIDLDVIAHALEQNIFVPGRLERVTNALSDFEVFVDYSHTPDALERAIKVLQPLASRIIVVFGCGGDRDKTKRAIMGSIASELADIIVLTNDNPRSENPSSIIDDIMTGISKDKESKVIAIEDRFKAIEYALSNAKENDAVLVAGKGHETYQEFADRTEDFSDVKVVEELLSMSKGK